MGLYTKNLCVLNTWSNTLHCAAYGGKLVKTGVQGVGCSCDYPVGFLHNFKCKGIFHLCLFNKIKKKPLSDFLRPMVKACFKSIEIIPRRRIGCFWSSVFNLFFFLKIASGSFWSFSIRWIS